MHNETVTEALFDNRPRFSTGSIYAQRLHYNKYMGSRIYDVPVDRSSAINARTFTHVMVLL